MLRPFAIWLVFLCACDLPRLSPEADLAHRAQAAFPGESPWAALPSVPGARYRHTATLLYDGNVLVAGGATSGTASLGTAYVFDAQRGTFRATGPLSGGQRSDHTAVLLKDGKVLVAGGWNGSAALSSAELYDPVTNSWQLTGALVEGTWDATLTVLQSGKVLVAGGGRGSSWTATDSAAVYDPDLGTWSPTANALSAARLRHTATLLRDGRVLVAGGKNDWSGSNSFELTADLYNPATNSWTSASNLATERAFATATLLPSGQVLVAGGRNPTGALDTAELFTPGTGAWTAAPALSQERAFTGATLLPSGRVLVSFGWNTNLGALDTAERFDPGSGWTGASPPTPYSARYDHSSTLLPSGRVLVVGGSTDTAVLDEVRVYDPQVPSWTPAAPLGTARVGASVTLLLDRRVLVAGGATLTASLATTELFDPATGAWTAGPTLAAARAHHTGTLLPDGRVLVVGEATGAELFDPATFTWSPAGTVQARQRHTATLLPSGKVLVAGGTWQSAALSSVEVYDLASGAWTDGPSLAQARRDHTATLLGTGEVLIAGGEGDGSVLAQAELFGAGGTWSAAPPLGTARARHAAAFLPGGRVLVSGGDNGSVALASTEVYTHGQGWAPAASLSDARERHSATLLLNGTVLVAGGRGGGELNTVETYDPLLNRWSLASGTSNLAVARTSHAAVVLADGSLLVVAGRSGTTALASVERYSEGRGSLPDWTPTLSGALVNVAPGGQLVFSGARLKGVSEGSGGGTMASHGNFPLVLLESAASGERHYASGVLDHTDTTVTLQLPLELPLGIWWLRVVVNGIPSLASPLRVVADNNPGPVPTRLAFVAQPLDAAVSAVLTPPVRVAVLDAQGNVVQSANTLIELRLDAHPGGAILGGTASAAAVGGVASFADLALDQPGAGYTLTATAPGLTGATSDPFDIRPPPLGSVVVSLTAGAGSGRVATHALGAATVTASAGAPIAELTLHCEGTGLLLAQSDFGISSLPAGGSLELPLAVTLTGAAGEQARVDCWLEDQVRVPRSEVASATLRVGPPATFTGCGCGASRHLGSAWTATVLLFLLVGRARGGGLYAAAPARTSFPSQSCSAMSASMEAPLLRGAYSKMD